MKGSHTVHTWVIGAFEIRRTVSLLNGKVTWQVYRDGGMDPVAICTKLIDAKIFVRKAEEAAQ